MLVIKRREVLALIVIFLHFLKLKLISVFFMIDKYLDYNLEEFHCLVFVKAIKTIHFVFLYYLSVLQVNLRNLYVKFKCQTKR